MKMEFSERLKKLPPYLFAEIDKLKRQARAQGHDIIDLGIGDPDIPTPEFVVDELYNQAKIQTNQKYAMDQGVPELRDEIAKWAKIRFNVELDAETEILPTIGSKEAITHFPLAILNSGDLALVPDPGYPAYKSGITFAGGEFQTMPLLEENGYMVDFSKMSEDTLKRAKLMYLNYPNNPTSACATREFYEEVIQVAKKYNIIICSDLAYSEMAYDGYKPLSIMEVEGAKDVAIEFHSFSKTYNMTGWRVAFAYGNAELIKLLAKVKSNYDSGIFQAIQYAALKALQNGQSAIDSNLSVYQERRDILVAGLKDLGYEIESPKATFYLWIKVPKGYKSSEFCMKLLNDAHLIVTPGNGFGECGEGYFRIAMTVGKEKLPEVLARLKKVEL